MKKRLYAREKKGVLEYEYENVKVLGLASPSRIDVPPCHFLN